MKTIRYKMCSLLLLISFLFMGMGVQSQEAYTRDYNERYEVNRSVNVEVENKFGMVKVTTTDENFVEVNVVITVEDASEKRAQEIFDHIEIQIDGSASEVVATTEIGGRFSNKSDKDDFSIDYTITMPRTGSVDITNKFGDCAIDDIDGEAELSVYYGALTTGKLNAEDNDVFLGFSKGTIQFIREGNIELEYSNLTIKGADRLEMDTQFSELRATAIGDLRMDSQYDTHELGVIGTLECDAQFSTISVELIARWISLDSSYGSLTVAETSEKLEKVTIDNEFGDVEIKFHNSPSLSIDAHASMGDIDFPKTDGLDKKDSGYTGKRIAGKIHGGNVPVELETSYGSIELDW